MSQIRYQVTIFRTHDYPKYRWMYGAHAETDLGRYLEEIKEVTNRYTIEERIDGVWTEITR